MKEPVYQLEALKLFSESYLWQLNRDFYQQVGIDAWNKGIVPHHLTSNSMVGKTYAELIFGFLSDLSLKGQLEDTVYILEMGAGHGRLAFHVLHHLQQIKAISDIQVPPFCYILSDIVEDNLQFFKNHSQLQPYFEQGILDFSYFDAIDSKEIYLEVAQIKIRAHELTQPIIAIGNYFFDSIPTDLFQIKDKTIAVCSIALSTKENPNEKPVTDVIKGLHLTYQQSFLSKPYYSDRISNELLSEYKAGLKDTFLFFPYKSFQCLENLATFSNKGLLLLSMDKGCHELEDLENKDLPEVIKHGSFSLWVNYHALGRFCEKKGGIARFPYAANYNLELACLFFFTSSSNISKYQCCISTICR